MEEKIKCLYYIKDLRTDKIIYIGQTINFQKRKRSHFSHKDQPIDKYMYEEGRENFLMEIFNNVDCTNTAEDEILNKEDELILYYDTINNGYNKRRSGNITNNIKEYEHNYHITYYQKLKENGYYNTEKLKNYIKEYRKSEKYKEYNKEHCKKYYYEHREEINARKRERRLKKKLEKLANETS